MRRRNIVVAIVALSVIAVFAADGFITRTYRSACYQKAEDVPRHRAALLLGTAKYLRDGRENAMYRFRIEATARLWRAGKVDYILASGDNGHRGYDEPS